MFPRRVARRFGFCFFRAVKSEPHDSGRVQPDAQIRRTLRFSDAPEPVVLQGRLFRSHPQQLQHSLRKVEFGVLVVDLAALVIHCHRALLVALHHRPELGSEKGSCRGTVRPFLLSFNKPLIQVHSVTPRVRAPHCHHAGDDY